MEKTFWMEVVGIANPGASQTKAVKARNERHAAAKLRAQGFCVMRLVSIDKDPTRKTKKGMLWRILSFFKR